MIQWKFLGETIKTEGTHIPYYPIIGPSGKWTFRGNMLTVSLLKDAHDLILLGADIKLPE